MKTNKPITLSLLITLLLFAKVKAQEEIDTLNLFADTTTFINNGVIVVGDVSNLAIKLEVKEVWEAYSIEKILALNIDSLATPTTYFIISLGDEPQDSVIYASGWIPITSIYPYWSEYNISPPVKVENHPNFYISADLLFETVTSYWFSNPIQNEFIYRETYQEWLEGVPFYFPIKAVVRRIITNLNTNIYKQEYFQLQQNYPNPFNGSTIIEYSLNEQSLVEIIIYNMLGENITTLVNEEMPAGNHKINFEPKNIPSGIYLYRINAGSFTSSRKMIYIK